VLVRYGIHVAILGPYAEPGLVVEVARVAAGAAAMARHRPASGPRDIAVTGASAGPGDPVAGAYAEAGATWWLEHIHERRGSRASMLERVSAGPP
jgi:hypothetical protein